MFRRTNEKGKRGKVRENDFPTNKQSNYPTSPGARRRVNSRVNRKHAKLPTAWLVEDDCEG